MLMELHMPHPTGGVGSTATLTEEDTWTDVMKVVGTMPVADASVFCYVGERALYLT